MSHKKIVSAAIGLLVAVIGGLLSGIVMFALGVGVVGAVATGGSVFMGLSAITATLVGPIV